MLESVKCSFYLQIPHVCLRFCSTRSAFACIIYAFSTAVGAPHSHQTTAQLVVVPFGQQPSAVWC